MISFISVYTEIIDLARRESSFQVTGTRAALRVTEAQLHAAVQSDGLTVAAYHLPRKMPAQHPFAPRHSWFTIRYQQAEPLTILVQYGR
ncbi:hypothetical protein E7V67_023590 [[Empedobacter] haloabium]|uniref:Uncharacterized protein n=1 Tax=[Empedobacter] haloabium TaxID=592317 RepID=A0ABZ1UK49_9BURK